MAAASGIALATWPLTSADIRIIARAYLLGGFRVGGEVVLEGHSFFADVAELTSDAEGSREVLHRRNHHGRPGILGKDCSF